MNKTILIVIGIACAVITAAGMMWYNAPEKVYWRLRAKNPCVYYALPLRIRMHGDEKSIPETIKLLQDDNDAVRQWAAKRLGELNVRESIPEIKKLLNDYDNVVRDAAARALKTLGMSAEEVEKAKEVSNDIIKLRQQLRDKDPQVRLKAIYTLGEFDDKKSIPMIKTLLKDKNDEVRSAAERALHKLGVPENEIQKAKEETEQERLLYTKALGPLKAAKLLKRGLTYAYYNNRYEVLRNGTLKIYVVQEGDKPIILEGYPYKENCEKRINDLEEFIRQHPDSVHLQNYKETITLLKQILQEGGNPIIPEGYGLYKENCEKTIKYLEELIRQYPDSIHLQNYKETITLLKQMVQEDEEFPYFVPARGTSLPVILAQEKNYTHREISPEEIVKTEIHYLRKECLLNKSSGIFKMCFDPPPTQELYPTISFGKRIVLMGNTAVPELVKLLDDRRPITVDDEIDSVPAKFYRYQDAAVDILQTMFSPEGNKINPKLPLAQRPFPVEIPAGEYFSEYLEKQTPENKQKIISDIKQWVEDAKEGK